MFICIILALLYLYSIQKQSYGDALKMLLLKIYDGALLQKQLTARGV